jgi:undecaprenyl-diphosphatase
MDAAIVKWLNALGGHVAPFDHFMAVIVSDYFAPVASSTVLLALWFMGRSDLDRYRNQLATFAGAISVGLANAQIAIINAFYFRTRPFVEFDLDVHFYKPTDSSFPANSAGVAFAVATVVYTRHRGLGISLYVVAVLWGIARVYAGVHYPTDILAGAAIGFIAAFASLWLVRALEVIPRRVLSVFRKVYIA